MSSVKQQLTDLRNKLREDMDNVSHTSCLTRLGRDAIAGVTAILAGIEKEEGIDKMSKIKVYGKPNCQGCDQVKGLLDTKGLGYEYVDIMSNMDAMRNLVSKGFRGVPQVFIDGDHVASNVAQLQAVLDEEGR